MERLDAITTEIREFLANRPDLLKDTYRGNRSHPLEGHCYVATEALYHALGGEQSEYTPCYVKHEDTTHWFLRSETGEVLDLTAEQFDAPVPYDDGRGCGFQNTPSERTERVLNHLDCEPSVSTT